MKRPSNHRKRPVDQAVLFEPDEGPLGAYERRPDVHVDGVDVYTAPGRRPVRTAKGDTQTEGSR